MGKSHRYRKSRLQRQAQEITRLVAQSRRDRRRVQDTESMNHHQADQIARLNERLAIRWIFWFGPGVVLGLIAGKFIG